MNELIFIISMFFFLGTVLGIYKIFGKAGLFMFIIFATILANIQVLKTIELFGVTTTCASVLYASTFLCTDILSEKHGKSVAKTSVFLGIFVSFLWLIGTQITLWFTPSDFDSSHAHLYEILSLAPRITLASLIGYAISQSLDVFLYHKIWSKTYKLWIRNNGSTLISQLVDSLIFFTIAFAFADGYSFSLILSLILTTYFFKIIVAFVDTPFIYLSKKIEPLNLEEILSEKKGEN